MLNRRNVWRLPRPCRPCHGPAGDGAAKKPFDGVQLSVLMEGHPTTDAIQKMLPEFKKQTGIDVALEVVPGADITAKELLEFSSKSGRYDVVQNNIIYMPGFVKSGYIVPLDDIPGQARRPFRQGRFRARLLQHQRCRRQSLRPTGLWREHLRHVPQGSVRAVRPRAPKTFDDIENAAKTISEKTNKEIAGITMRGQQGIQGVYVWAAYLWGFGGSFLDARWQVGAGTPEGTAALDAFTKVLNDYGPVGVANFGWEENRCSSSRARRRSPSMPRSMAPTMRTRRSHRGRQGRLRAGADEIDASPKGGSSSLAVHSLYVTADSRTRRRQHAVRRLGDGQRAATEVDRDAIRIPASPRSPRSTATISASATAPSRKAMIAAINQGNPQYLPTVEQAERDHQQHRHRRLQGARRHRIAPRTH